jgi:HPr kinase/phosphorylase
MFRHVPKGSLPLATPLHASCVAFDGDGVLFLGPPGAGKSELVLRLLRRGWALVADDQVQIEADDEGLLAMPPAALRGMLEVRGLGLFRDIPVAAPARLRLAVELLPAGTSPDRLPEPARYAAAGHDIPRVALAGHEAAAPDKVALALDAVRGRATCAVGALAPPGAA